MNDFDAFLQAIPQPQRDVLLHIRQLVHKRCPDVTEVITYGMPGFKYKGKYLLAFSNFKDHMSLFPGADAVVEFEKELESFKTSKGTIQFTAEQQLGDTLIANIIMLCMERIDRTASRR